MIGTIKEIDIRSFYGLTVTKVELSEYVLKFYFGDNRLDVEEAWEYQDKNQKVLDRCYSEKFRKSFLLDELVNYRLDRYEKISTENYLWFTNQKALVIYIEPSADYSPEYLVAKDQLIKSMRMKGS